MTATKDLFVPAGAETLFGITALDLGPHTGELEMASGPWLRDGDRVGRAALAVVFDDVTGYVVAAGAEDGRWPVSLGMHLDFLSDPPTDGSTLRARGELLRRDVGGGWTTGRVTNEKGEVLVVATQRSHLVATDRPVVRPSTVIPAGTTDDRPLREILGVAGSAHHDDRSRTLELPPSDMIANTKGSVHGGVLVCVVEMAAMQALEAGPRLELSSIDVAFLRPCDAGEAVTFRAEVVHSGRTLQLVRVAAENVHGKTCALATVTTRTT
ncbi:uncharacterized protein (TIGR00369 family) [Williamsia limnetica]|uniref:Uncharacterized protein (TIGR00369 family) n=1 Tax=Williamsia limnetica TaxID=882452 RepID=A0A318RCG2_WILLI|nr:hotdog fold thioesterase [Williamsia limnetica]PYE12336.1 uncharacterized protein (TIGR00369 family) [Williamsia limnetica]